MIWILVDEVTDSSRQQQQLMV